jgi:Glycosyltransferase Family 4
MRIALIISALSAGGAERVIATLANCWAARGWRVTLITFEPPGTAPYYEVDPRVTLRQLGIASVGSPLWLAIWQKPASHPGAAGDPARGGSGSGDLVSGENQRAHRAR